MKNLIAIICLLMSTAAWGQHKLTGRILDANTKEPLIGATISLPATSQGTTTDLKGFFELDIAQKGEYKLVFSFVGYEQTEKTFQISGENIIQLLLTPKPVSLGVLDIYGNRTYPVTKTELDQPAIERQNLGQDLPILLNFTPSIVTTSDAGAGVGYTGMRIRGSDPQRINVTVNGIPINDAESHGTFWVNMPDFASSVDNVTIQRGVGTSTNGAGAFGATVNLTTETAGDQSFAEYNGSYGSFNTLKNSVEFGTGKIGNLSITGRLSKITSDGYIDNAWSDLRSFYLTGTHESKLGTFTANIFSGQEQTFQAWNGVPEGQLEAGNRTYNELAGYDNETDNYQQDHYQFLYRNDWDNWTANAAFHYTKGRGYFEQYKSDESFEDYQLEDPNLVIVNPDTGEETPVEETDIIRRRWLDNDFYGVVYSLNYRKDKVDWIIGGGWNRYEGAHFGEVIWSEYASNGSIRHPYYDNDATKTDFNIYSKLVYEVVEGLNLFADLQLRNVDYTFLGFDNQGNNVEQTDQLTFFNPKVGARYNFGNNEIYALFAIGNKEPNRDDYTESSINSRPEHETLRNIELGYSGSLSPTISIAANLYLMDYKNQLVLTGEINDVGAYSRANIENSYRAGIELQAKAKVSDKLIWEANATFSRNRIPEFIEYIDSFDENFDYLGQEAINHGETDLVLSPNIILGSQLRYMPAEGLELALLSKYVGKQYLDNTSNDSRALDPYFVNDLRFSYQFSQGLLKRARLSLLVNNIGNVKYESNGYTYGWLVNGVRDTYNYYYPQAGTNFLLGLQVRF